MVVADGAQNAIAVSDRQAVKDVAGAQTGGAEAVGVGAPSSQPNATMATQGVALQARPRASRVFRELGRSWDTIADDWAPYPGLGQVSEPSHTAGDPAARRVRRPTRAVGRLSPENDDGPMKRSEKSTYSTSHVLTLILPLVSCSARAAPADVTPSGDAVAAPSRAGSSVLKLVRIPSRSASQIAAAAEEAAQPGASMRLVRPDRAQPSSAPATSDAPSSPPDAPPPLAPLPQLDRLDKRLEIKKNLAELRRARVTPAALRAPPPCVPRLLFPPPPPTISAPALRPAAPSPTPSRPRSSRTAPSPSVRARNALSPLFFSAARLLVTPVSVAFFLLPQHHTALSSP